MNKADAVALAAFQPTIQSRMPAGSTFKFELVYNNAGFIQLTQPERECILVQGMSSAAS